MFMFSRIEGSVDYLDQALMHVAVLQPVRQTILAAVDTGFNGGLWLTSSHAREVGLSVPPETVPVIQADGRRILVGICEVEISWFGYPELTTARISSSEYERRSGHEQVALLGTSLLAQSQLTIDYRTRRFRIER